MRTFYVTWTYLGNYSERPTIMDAESAADAAERIFRGFSDDFRAKGSVYVTTEAPQCFGRAAGRPPLDLR